MTAVAVGLPAFAEALDDDVVTTDGIELTEMEQGGGGGGVDPYLAGGGGGGGGQADDSDIYMGEVVESAAL